MMIQVSFNEKKKQLEFKRWKSYKSKLIIMISFVILCNVRYTEKEMITFIISFRPDQHR